MRRQAETEEEGVWSRDDITSVPYEQAEAACRLGTQQNRGVEKQFPQSTYVDMTRNLKCAAIETVISKVRSGDLEVLDGDPGGESDA